MSPQDLGPKGHIPEYPIGKSNIKGTQSKVKKGLKSKRGMGPNFKK